MPCDPGGWPVSLFRGTRPILHAVALMRILFEVPHSHGSTIAPPHPPLSPNLKQYRGLMAIHSFTAPQVNSMCLGDEIASSMNRSSTIVVVMMTKSQSCEQEFPIEDLAGRSGSFPLHPQAISLKGVILQDETLLYRPTCIYQVNRTCQPMVYLVTSQSPSNRALFPQARPLAGLSRPKSAKSELEQQEAAPPGHHNPRASPSPRRRARRNHHHSRSHSLLATSSAAGGCPAPSTSTST
ncbi:hypothetical protein Pelo_11358 [Pelomyxa schiedti]|nr:hypothetical protein Pelo_11358 [Pelomyxa schiedti]